MWELLPEPILHYFKLYNIPSQLFERNVEIDNHCDNIEPVAPLYYHLILEKNHNSITDFHQSVFLLEDSNYHHLPALYHLLSYANSLLMFGV